MVHVIHEFTKQASTLPFNRYGYIPLNRHSHTWSHTWCNQTKSQCLPPSNTGWICHNTYNNHCSNALSKITTSLKPPLKANYSVIYPFLLNMCNFTFNSGRLANLKAQFIPCKGIAKVKKLILRLKDCGGGPLFGENSAIRFRRIALRQWYLGWFNFQFNRFVPRWNDPTALPCRNFFFSQKKKLAKRKTAPNIPPIQHLRPLQISQATI